MLSQDQLASLVAGYGYWGVFALVSLESMGIPLPGEATLVAAAIIAGTSHTLDVRWVIAAASAGAIVGDNVGFWIGREFGYRVLLRYGRYVRLTERRIKLGQFLFQRWGGAVVFFGRFVAILRAVAALVAGANHMQWPRFLLFNAAGGVVWATIYGLAAYLVGRKVTAAAGPAGIVVGLAAVILLVIGILLIRRFEKELSDQAEQAFPGPLPGRAGLDDNRNE